MQTKSIFRGEGKRPNGKGPSKFSFEGFFDSTFPEFFRKIYKMIGKKS